MDWSREQFQEWLSKNQWYIVNGVIKAAGGAAAGYLCANGRIGVIEHGAIRVVGCLASAALANYGAVANFPDPSGG